MMSTSCSSIYYMHDGLIVSSSSSGPEEMHGCHRTVIANG